MTKYKKIRKIIALLLLPAVVYGMYQIYQSRRTDEVQAVDPLTITYHCDTVPGCDETPSPVFYVTNMLPGDETEEEINVKNNTGETLAIAAKFVKTEETQEFADILDTEITVNPTIFSGSLENLFSQGYVTLFNLAPSEDKSFRVKVKFPSSAGNEYQLARVVFNIIFGTEVGIDLPQECEPLRGKIVSVIEGTEGDDFLHGNIYPNLILAKGGDDIIDSSSSGDCVVGGEGNDIIGSESGDDIVLGGGGNDQIKSGSGNDIVWGGEGNDTIIGGTGNDKVYGEGGDDYIDGGTGNDEAWGGDGADTIAGGSGQDKLYGEAGNDTIKGGSDNDILDGGADTDSLTGNTGTDTCVAGETTSSCEL